VAPPLFLLLHTRARALSPSLPLSQEEETKEEEKEERGERGLY
jgi:hypothetical protein